MFALSFALTSVVSRHVSQVLMDFDILRIEFSGCQEAPN